MASATQTRRTTETLPFTETRQNLSEIVNRVARGETRILVEKNGVPAVAIVPAEYLREIDRIDERRDALFETISEISRAFADVPIEELERQVALAIAENRAESRARRERGEIE